MPLTRKPPRLNRYIRGLLLWSLLAACPAAARSFGPPLRVTGAPGDNPLACTQCHNSFPLNSGKGSVRVVFPGGSYRPGMTYRLRVEVRDPDQQRWGFQLSARLASDPANAQAGDLVPTSDLTRVVCGNGAAKPCTANNQIQLIMHTVPGTRTGIRTGADFEFDWTAPSAGAGTVSFYVAGNAANGDGTNQGDYIYTSSLTIQEETAPLGVRSSAYDVAHLVSDLSGWADRLDNNLAVPWGMALGPATAFWVSNAGTGTSTLYNSNGEPFPVGAPLVVRIPQGAGRAGPSQVTGQVWNGTPAFEIRPGAPATFLFATQSGVIAAWNRNVDPVNAVVVADNPSAVYTGLALGVSSQGPVLYAADFKNRVIEVFDGGFKPIQLSGGFRDPNLPGGYGPFNIQRFGVSLYVTYARQSASGVEEEPVDGGGIINVFDADGNLLRRLFTGGPLNAPWGLAMAPSFFGEFSNTLLVGNLGDGRIHAIDPATGRYAGTLRYRDGNPVALEGLYGLITGNGRSGGDPNAVYFTAAVSGQARKGPHGVFGRITVLP